MDKKGTGSTGWIIAVLVIAVLVIFYPQISKIFPTAPAAPAGGIPATTTEGGQVCPVDTTTLSYSAVDVEHPGTTIGVTLRYWLNEVPKGTMESTGTATVSPGDKVEALFGISNATYYGSRFNGASQVPCKGTYTVAGKLWAKDSGVVMTVFDENDNQQDGAGVSNNQTMGVGEQKQLKLRVHGTYQKYYGNPEVDLQNNLIADYSRTEYASVKVLKDGVELAAAGVPTVEPVSSTANTHVGFLMPKIAGSANVDYTLVIKADNVNNPSADIALKIYDADYFYNTITGKVDKGWEDQDKADIGITSEPAATVFIS